MGHNIAKRFILPILAENRPGATFILVKMKNIKGVLSNIFRVLSDYAVNVLEGMHSRETEEYGYWLALIVLPKNIDVQELIREIKKLEGVLDISIGRTEYERLIIPPWNVEYGILPNMSVSLWRYEWFAMVKKGLIKRFGETGKALLYHVGYNAGLLAADYWRKNLGEKSPEKLIRFALDILQRMGWFKEYRLTLRSITKPSLKIVIRDGIETVDSKHEDKMECSFLRGVLEGYFTGIYGHHVSTRERCMREEGQWFCYLETED